jgi:hypothetical protein
MKFARLILLIAVVSAVAACGAHGGATPTTVTPQPSSGETATAKPGGPIEPTATPTAEDEERAADPADYTVSDAGVYFFTPSRNIACGLAPGITGCQVFKTTAIPPGADCDHGSQPRDELSKGYYVDEREVITPSCFNQGLFNASADQKVLDYGRSLTAAGTVCASWADGVTCARGEHGFFVSAQSFKQW